MSIIRIHSVEDALAEALGEFVREGKIAVAPRAATRMAAHEQRRAGRRGRPHIEEADEAEEVLDVERR